MKKLALIMVAFVAIEHVAFMVLEMFLWTAPVGMRVFALTPEFAIQSAPLAANQGLYNGFLAAGLLWGLARRDEGFGLCVFFLSCIIVAGVFGAATAKMSILYVQAAPAFIALVLVMMTRRQSISDRG